MPRAKTSISTPTAHLVGPGKLKVINGRLAFSNGDGAPTRLDPEHLVELLCYGDVGISDEAFTVLFRHNVAVAWMSPRGARFRGRLTALSDSSTRLRMLQHRALADPARQREMATQTVHAKIQSQIEVARHQQRHGRSAAKEFLRSAKRYMHDLDRAADIDVVRGLEGVCSKAWFQLMSVVLEPPWQFSARTRRPPTDPVNALLSLGYTWLLNRMIARVQAAGLEVNLGALHDFRPGRPSLACDLIEPLRAPVVDRWVLQLCNRHRVQPADFEQQVDGGVRLVAEVFPRILGMWEQMWGAVNGDRQVGHQIAQLEQTLRGTDSGDPTP